MAHVIFYWTISFTFFHQLQISVLGKTWLTSLDEAIDWYETNEARGEYVLVFEGADAKALEEERQAAWETMSIEEHMAIYLSKGQTKKEAMKSVASDRGMTKREVYQYLLH